MRFSRVTSLVLAICLVALPLAPTPHVHETEDHDHHNLMVHSHGAAHHVHVQHDIDADDHGATVDDVDSVVLTLDPVLALPHAYAAIATPVTVAVAMLEPPAVVAPVLPIVVKPLAHSPARAPAILRGPPSPSFL